MLLGGFRGLDGGVEVALFAADGLLEDQGLAGMGGLQALDEGEEAPTPRVKVPGVTTQPCSAVS